MSLRFGLASLLLTIVAPVGEVRSQYAGFERQVTADGTEIGIWYPASGRPVRQRLGLHTQDVVPGARVPVGQHPLIIISHGNGGDLSGHVDTAISLAQAGFIVAALTHPGDNWRDNSMATQIERRPDALSATISYMSQEWSGRSSIDLDRIGGFGFSAGGFTVLAAAGGRPNLALLAAHCRLNPSFFDCALLKAQPRGEAGAWPELRDPRIKAIVVAAPALGFTFGRAGLANVTMPVQLWRADDDRILPAPFYADAVKAALPRQPEFHTVPRAGHFDFLAPCANPTAMPQLCQSANGFDRKAFHRHFNREVVRFFSINLRR